MAAEQSGVDCRGDRVHLCCISGAEYGQYAEQGEQDRHPAPFRSQAVFDVIHRSSGPVSVLVLLTEMDCKGHLGEFGAHSQQG